MASSRETVLQALYSALSTIEGPDVLRNQPEVMVIPKSGLVILWDGEPGEPDPILSPPSWSYNHRAEVQVQVQDKDQAARDAAMDAILQSIGDVIAADDSLGGAVDMATVGGPELIDEAVEGGATIKAALVPIDLEYVSPTPLG